MEKIQEFFKTTFQNSFTAILCASGINLMATPYFAAKSKILSMNDKIRSGHLDRPYYSVFDCALRTVKEEGFAAFFKGNQIKNILPSIGYKTLTFTVFYSLQRLTCFQKQFKDLNFYQSLVMNSLFGMVSPSISLMVSENILKSKFLLRSQNIQKRILKIVRKKGTENCKRHMKNIKASEILEKGFKESVFGHILGKGVYFGAYESGKEFLPENYKGKLEWEGALALGVSYCAQRVQDRVNWIKRLMEVTNFRQGGNASQLECLRFVVENEGWTSFLRCHEPWKIRNMRVKNALMLVMFGKLQERVNCKENQDQ